MRSVTTNSESSNNSIQQLEPIMNALSLFQGFEDCCPKTPKLTPMEMMEAQAGFDFPSKFRLDKQVKKIRKGSKLLQKGKRKLKSEDNIIVNM